jgi:hypothetical protein
MSQISDCWSAYYIGFLGGGSDFQHWDGLLISNHDSHRLTASLIELSLRSGAGSRHRVLTAFAGRLTGFTITDAIELENEELPVSDAKDFMIEYYVPLSTMDRLFVERDRRCHIVY